MAKIKTISYDPFKRGDTPVFSFSLPSPSTGFSWTGITADAALTAVAAPTDNTGAAVIRLSQSLTVDASNTATFSFQLTIAESTALTPGTIYKVEVQLKSGSTNVATVSTGEVLVVQDYVI